MAVLAHESAGSSQTYTDDEKAAMQTQFNKLADDINKIVDSTESDDGNKLLSTDGLVISASVDNAAAVQIFPKDLSIDVVNLDLTIAPGGAGLAVVVSAMEQISDYRKYFNDKTERLEEVIAAAGLDIASITGVESDLQKALTTNKADEMVKQVIEKAAVLLQTHTSVDAEMALQLLE